MVIAIIQARTGSSRLPQKVLLKIREKTLLELYIARLRRSRSIDKIVIATTQKPDDLIIEEIARKCRIDCFKGAENDLVDRYYQCAKKYEADTIVRVTSDDPFVDYQIIDRAITIFRESRADFVTNHFKPTYPEGLDVEIYSFQTLKRIWQDARLPSEREHVFPFVENNQDKFKIINFSQNQNNSHIRWTIDYECDYEMTKAVYDVLYDDNPVFLQKDILDLLEKNPQISELNNHIERKEGVNKSKSLDTAAS
jgi:spore coat polysaccharide biosynthesis protein SpsF (cytidylyltransferase family)